MDKYERQILEHMRDGMVSAGTFKSLCGSAKMVKKMFREGWVEGHDRSDLVRSGYLSVTDKGRKALADR